MANILGFTGWAETAKFSVIVIAMYTLGLLFFHVMPANWFSNALIKFGACLRAKAEASLPVAVVAWMSSAMLATSVYYLGMRTLAGFHCVPAAGCERDWSIAYLPWEFAGTKEEGASVNAATDFPAPIPTDTATDTAAVNAEAEPSVPSVNAETTGAYRAAIDAYLATQ